MLFHYHAEYVCYDDGCHLKKYSTNPCRKDLTATSKKIAQLSIVVDKMHMAGHVDSWCKRNCDPRNFKDLDAVGFVQIMHQVLLTILFLFLTGGHRGL